MIVSKQVKVLNMSRIMRIVWMHPGESRTGIARRLGLDKSTLTSLARELIAMRLLETTHVGEAGPHGGRKPIGLSVNRDFGTVLGFEIRPERYTAVAVNLVGDVVYSRTEQDTVNGANLASSFLRQFERTRKEVEGLGAPLVGVGVGLSGMVNPNRGIIYQSYPLGIVQPFDFSAAVLSKIPVPFFVDNDANCCAWGEIAFRKQDRLRDFLFVLVELRENSVTEEFSVGVGLGLVFGGKVHRGHQYSAGEFRSVLWRDQHGAASQFSLSPPELRDVTRADGVRARLFQELGAHIGLMVNVLNLEHVFVGGDVERYRNELTPILYEQIQRNWPYPNKVTCTVHYSSLSDKTVAYGAAGMFLDRLFADSEVSPEDHTIRPKGVPLITGIESVRPTD